MISCSLLLLLVVLGRVGLLLLLVGGLLLLARRELRLLGLRQLLLLGRGRGCPGDLQGPALVLNSALTLELRLREYHLMGGRAHEVLLGRHGHGVRLGLVVLVVGLLLVVGEAGLPGCRCLPRGPGRRRDVGVGGEVGGHAEVHARHVGHVLVVVVHRPGGESVSRESATSTMSGE